VTVSSPTPLIRTLWYNQAPIVCNVDIAGETDAILSRLGDIDGGVNISGVILLLRPRNYVWKSEQCVFSIVGNYGI